MEARDTSSEQALLQTIVGEQLSSVEFVQDYVQLRFDGPTLTAFTSPTVLVGPKEFQWGAPGFRDELCGRIARRVVRATINGTSVSIAFDEGAVVRIPLRPDDHRDPEAVKFQVSPSGEWWVL
jgi:hypothetical protein